MQRVGDSFRRPPPCSLPRRSSCPAEVLPRRRLRPRFRALKTGAEPPLPWTPESLLPLIRDLPEIATASSELACLLGEELFWSKECRRLGGGASEHCCLPSCREAVRDTGALPELESCRWPSRRVLSCRREARLFAKEKALPFRSARWSCQGGRFPSPSRRLLPGGCEDCLLELVVAEERRTKILVVECCCLVAKTLLSLGVVTPE